MQGSTQLGAPTEPMEIAIQLLRRIRIEGRALPTPVSRRSSATAAHRLRTPKGPLVSRVALFGRPHEMGGCHARMGVGGHCGALRRYLQ
jgi:hypothetical protein